MKPTAIVTLLLVICIKSTRPYQIDDGDCPTIQVASSIQEVNRNFFHLKTWYVYAYTDPHPSYMSMFHIPQGISPYSHCLRLHSEKVRGLVLIHYNCLNFKEMYYFTLYSEHAASDVYQQVQSYKNLYRTYRRFNTARVLVTDGDSYVVFYGCQMVRNKALIGLMFLVRTDVYDRFVPPPDLMQQLRSKLSFNVSGEHIPAVHEHDCDCQGVIRDMQRTIMDGNLKQLERKKAEARMKKHFAQGIRNFFVCVFSFMVWLLGTNRIIDRYVFDLKY